MATSRTVVTVKIDGNVTIKLPQWKTSTNLGRLTKTSFPGDCLQNLVHFTNPSTGLGLPYTFNTQGCALSQCCPSGNFYTEDWAYITSFYSPGICPSEYRKCDLTESHPAIKTAGDEFVQFCCPNNYECPSITSGVLINPCKSTLKSATVVTVFGDIHTQKLLSTTRQAVTQGPESAMVQLAYPVQIRFREGDDVNSDGGGGGGNGLSTGAIVGIVFGVIFGVLLAATVATAWWVRRRRAQRLSRDRLEQEAVAVAATEATPMVDGMDATVVDQGEGESPKEVPAAAAVPSELESTGEGGDKRRHTYELHGDSMPAEMAGKPSPGGDQGNSS